MEAMPSLEAEDNHGRKSGVALCFPLVIPATILPREIASRLSLLPTVYRMLEEGMIPALKSPGGGKWIISRRRYEEWEATLGRSGGTSAGA